MEFSKDLRDKVEARLLKDFTKDELRYFHSNNLMLAGGSILSIMYDQELKDYDMFLSKEPSSPFQFIKINKDLKDKFRWDEKFETPNAITYEKHDLVYSKVQIIHTQFSGGSHSETLDRFDLEQCKIGYCFQDRKIIWRTHPKYINNKVNKINRDAIEKYHGNMVDIGVLKRLFKYASKGYTISNRELLYAFANIYETKKSEDNLFQAFFGLGMSENLLNLEDNPALDGYKEKYDAEMAKLKKIRQWEEIASTNEINKET
jgi:hypothetical protein